MHGCNTRYTPPMPGIFIILEGPDGSGTTTQSQLLAERLRAQGKEVVLSEEPTEGQFGQRIRAALNGGEKLQPEELQQLFCSDRAEHVTNVIQPALRDGKVVISDRYIPSTLIYGEAAGVACELLEEWNAEFPVPDFMVFALPSFEVCWERVRERGVQDAFEKEQFQRKIHEGYIRYAKEHPDVLVIDTSKEVEECVEEILNSIKASN